MKTFKIFHAPETMTSKERVIRTFYYEKTDRIPIDYDANPGIHHKLCRALGIANDDKDQLLVTLGVDYRCAHPKYIGPDIFPQIPGLIVDREYGFYTRWIENEFGGYEDICNFPLQDAAPEVIDKFVFPSPDDYDYSGALEKLNYNKHYANYIGNSGIGCIINTLGTIMGMEDTLINLMLEQEETLALMDRKIDFDFGILECMLDKAKGKIDFMFLGEDLGTQINPLISGDMYNNILRPRHQRFIDLAKAYSIPVMMHTCGSSSWVYEDFITMGISAVDTLQPEAVNMSPRYLKDHFGGRLSFHGCISTGGPLAFGTPKDVRKIASETLEIMMPGGGYHFSPAHEIQDNTPVENVITLYQTAHDLGRYL